MPSDAITTKPRSEQRQGNQHARRHGWTSAQHPAPIQAILTAVDTAVSHIYSGNDPAAIADAFTTLRKAERALRFRQEHEAARLVRQSSDLARNALRDTPSTESTDFALYAPESAAAPSAERPAQPDAALPAGVPYAQPTMPSRIAVGYRPSRGQGTFPN